METVAKEKKEAMTVKISNYRKKRGIKKKTEKEELKLEEIRVKTYRLT